MYELLDSLHKKILQSNLAEEITESEIEALVIAKELFKGKKEKDE